MSLAKNTYEDDCSNCGKTVWIEPLAPDGHESSDPEKWVRCSECRKITLVQKTST